jgi:sterol desaturase/sphingolipid hydroxylase (fatty acid hydroxylase superfamily)
MSFVPPAAFYALGLTLLLGLASVLVGAVAERLRPARAATQAGLVFNMAYFVPAAVLQALLAPFAAALSVWAVNAAGGGWIVLPGQGWPMLAGFVAYALAMDFGEYAFHRAQHRFPFLWSMHALHHSDPALGVSTTLRHFWADPLLKSVSIYLVVGIVFRVPPAILALYNLLAFYNYVPHTNLRLGLGPLSFLVNAPQYHRLHHSALSEHRDCNFAALFPLFDILFGTYRRPLPGEYPPSGLDADETPVSVAQALVWPLRSCLPVLHTYARVFLRGRVAGSGLGRSVIRKFVKI